VLLKAELGQVKKEHEFEMTKLMQASVEVVVNHSSAQVKIDDLKDEIGHVRGLNENYRILLANFHILGNRCHNELLKTFSTVGALSKAKKFLDGDLEGLMRWVLSEKVQTLSRSYLPSRGMLILTEKFVYARQAAEMAMDIRKKLQSKKSKCI
jgi:hypothetical protein